MEPKKYWWISVREEGSDWDMAIDIHPFTYMDMRWKGSLDAVLLNWKLIGVDEYNLFNELNNK